MYAFSGEPTIKIRLADIAIGSNPKNLDALHTRVGHASCFRQSGRRWPGLSFVMYHDMRAGALSVDFYSLAFFVHSLIHVKIGNTTL